MRKHCLFCYLFLLHQDILENESINLDWMFRYSLINDLVKVRGDQTESASKQTNKKNIKRQIWSINLDDVFREMVSERSLLDVMFNALCALETENEMPRLPWFHMEGLWKSEWGRAREQGGREHVQKCFSGSAQRKKLK